MLLSTGPVDPANPRGSLPITRKALSTWLGELWQDVAERLYTAMGREIISFP